jgi:hypothetical protein
MEKTIIKTANNKYISEAYYQNRLDMETNERADAHVFGSVEEANDFLQDGGFDQNYAWAIALNG